MQSKKSGFAASFSFVLFAAATVWLTAFALPASAAGQKTISLSVTPNPAPLSTQTTVVYAKITNTGNSNANSFEVDWTTSPYFRVIGASAGGTAGSCSTPGLKGAGYSGCVFLKQLPTKTFVTIALTVEVTNQCAALSIDWYAYAWTGAPGPASQSFQLVPGPVNTSSSPSCAISFGTQPSDTFVGSIITGSPLDSAGNPVTVQLRRNGAPASGVDVSLSATPASCATGAASVTTDASGLAEVAFTGADAGACVLTATAPEYGSVSSRSFQVAPHGDLGCAADNNTFGTTGPGGLVLNGTRLANVDDPSPTAVGGTPAPECVVVPYVVSATCPDGVTGTCTNLVYDALDQGTHMAFHFRWEWPLETVPEGGIDAIPETLQLFINGNAMPVELNLCPHTVAVYDGSDFVELIADPLYTGPLPHPQDQDTVAPGTQAGCLIGRNVIQDGSGLRLIEDAWVQGDYVARRN